MHFIHEPSILANLEQRADLANQRPYTFLGTVLVAVNPLRQTPDPRYSDYVDRPLDPEAPHPYAIAEFGYQQMRLRGQSQSIVVSGESGAGKTENAKVLLSYLLPEIVENIRTSQCTEDVDPSPHSTDSPQ